MKLNIDLWISIISTFALMIIGLLSLLGVDVSTTFAIVIVGAYIGSNVWLGLEKIANIIASKV